MKRPSYQIRSTCQLYGWIGLGGDNEILEFLSFLFMFYSAFEVLTRPTLNTVQFTFLWIGFTLAIVMLSTCHFSKFSGRSEQDLYFALFLFHFGWMCCSFRRPMVEVVIVLGVIGRRLVSYFLLSDSKTTNPPQVWLLWNSCTTSFLVACTCTCSYIWRLHMK